MGKQSRRCREQKKPVEKKNTGAELYQFMVEMWIEHVRGRLEDDVRAVLESVGNKSWFEHVMREEKVDTADIPFLALTLSKPPYSELTANQIYRMMRAGEIAHP